MIKKNASSPPAPSSPRRPRVYMGALNDDDEGSLEAPRRARSDRAYIALIEKARAKRAAYLAAFAPATPPPAPAPAPPPAPAAAAPPPAHAAAAKPRKARTDKGKRRGHLVRPGTAAASHEEPDEEWYPPPTSSGYANCVIV